MWDASNCDLFCHESTKLLYFRLFILLPTSIRLHTLKKLFLFFTFLISVTYFEKLRITERCWYKPHPTLLTGLDAGFEQSGHVEIRFKHTQQVCGSPAVISQQ